MKKLFTIIAISAALALSACSRVEPNEIGVLMENYGKQGKEDFTVVSGKVATFAPGTALYTVPMWEQRGNYSGKLKSSDNTEFVLNANYSYNVLKEGAIDLILQTKHVVGEVNADQSVQTNKDKYMFALEQNIINPRLNDVVRDYLLQQSSEDLMASGGTKKLNDDLRKIVEAQFQKAGLKLNSFNGAIDYSPEVKAIIDKRNQSNTQVSTIDSQIIQARKQLELEQVTTQIAQEKSRGLTEELLRQQFIEKWDGSTPLYGVDTSVLVNGK